MGGSEKFREEAEACRETAHEYIGSQMPVAAREWFEAAEAAINAAEALDRLDRNSEAVES